MNFVMKFVFGLLSEKIRRLAAKRNIQYSYFFVRSDGEQLSEIGALVKSGRIRPVIDKVFPFDQSIEAHAYLEQGRAKGKVVVRIQ